MTIFKKELMTKFLSMSTCHILYAHPIYDWSSKCTNVHATYIIPCNYSFMV
jgi:hypothetical protein